MKRHLLTLGIVGGVLIAVLQWTQYRFLVVENSVEIYGALVAAIFAALGIWLGLRLTSRRTKVVIRQVTVPAVHPFVPDRAKQDDLGITPREMEILALIARGMSNREIATTLFVSENTVKTHCSRAFDKLGARRRTHAVQRGKEMGLLP